MLSKEEVDILIERIREIGKSYVLSDIHVHPYEVLYGGIKYFANPHHDGLYSVNNLKYEPPETGPIHDELSQKEMFLQFDPRLRANMQLLSFRRNFAHTGPMLFSDHMKLCGMRRALLLPVMGPDEDDDATMILMKRMFGKDDRFVLGYCVPNSVRNDDIAKDIRDAIKQYQVKAIKIHPNRTKIDLASRSGIERIFHILEASRDVKLPVIVHGGNSLTVQDEGTISYSSANNLQHIEWGITKEPVIIAHAGAFGHDVEEVANKIIPIMNKLLARYDNLLVDVAGLEMNSLGIVLNAIDVNKILFGSDALYYFQWQAAAKLLFTLKKSFPGFENDFVKIASVNPGKYLRGWA